MSLYLECLGESVLERMRILHATYDSTGQIRATMLALFGEPEHCLVCAKPLNWEREPPNDIDPWFCSDCCPVCGGSEREYEVA